MPPKGRHSGWSLFVKCVGPADHLNPASDVSCKSVSEPAEVEKSKFNPGSYTVATLQKIVGCVSQGLGHHVPQP